VNGYGIIVPAEDRVVAVGEECFVIEVSCEIPVIEVLPDGSRVTNTYSR
jgi:hypothetical protein